MDPSWYILEPAYSLLLALVQTQPQFVESYLTSSFLIQLTHNYHSHDVREQKQITQLIYRIYAAFSELRFSVKFALQMCIQEYLSNEGWCEGVGEALGFYAIILKGMSVPIREEHIVFLNKYLFALLKQSRIEYLYANCEKCFKQYIEKDPSFAVPIVSTVLRFWPRGNLNKEIAFVMLLEKCIQLVDNEDVLSEICEPIRKRLCTCVESENMLVAEKVLRLFCDDGFLKKLLRGLKEKDFRLMLDSVEERSWSIGVKKQCRRVKELYDCTVIVHWYVCLIQLRHSDADAQFALLRQA